MIFEDPRDQEAFDRIANKSVPELTGADKGFLRARRAYLSKDQENKFRGVLKLKDDPIQPPQEIKAAPPIFAQPPQNPYNDLLVKARALGYKGPRVPRVKLEEFIAQNTP